MDLSDSRTNFRLKREVLASAMEVFSANPGSTQKDYNLRQEDLDAMEISEQNEVLTEVTEHLHFLRDTLQKWLGFSPVIHLQRLLLLRCGLLRPLRPLLHGSNAG